MFRYPSRHDPEDGFTVMEVTIASALLLVVTTIMFSVLISLTNSSQRTHALVNNEQKVRFVLLQMARDIRASNPLETFPAKSTYDNKIQLKLGPNTGPQTTVVWTYVTDPTSANYQTLSRTVTTSAGVTTGGIVLNRVRNVQTGSPVFQYFSQSGLDLVTTSTTTAADVGNCAIRVKLTIRSDSDPGPQPFVETLDSEIRNRLPGGVGCG